MSAIPPAANDGYYEVFWPRGQRQMKSKTLARRLDTLNGKTIAQLWDFIFSGDKVFEALEEGIRKRYPDVRFVSWREFGNTHGADERDPRGHAAAPQGARRRCRDLRNGLLRELHTRRAAGECGVRSGRRACLHAGL